MLRLCVVILLTLLLPGILGAQEPSVLDTTAWDVVRWDYPAAPSPPHTGFVLEVCLMQGSTCALVRQWRIDPRILTMQVPKAYPGERKCYQVWAVNAAGSSERSNPLCTSP